MTYNEREAYGIVGAALGLAVILAVTMAVVAWRRPSGHESEVQQRHNAVGVEAVDGQQQGSER